ncbi:MAG: hypothetical protein AAF642_14290 [Pseudomonadota bacterium]
MQWLIANMWIAMAAATVLGLLFGFALRGLMVGSRIRKAEVEREIAKTELTQSKAEAEALYAAQRKHKEEAAAAPGGGDVLVAALDERENRIAALGEELASARAEVEALQASKNDNDQALETAGAAVAGAVAGAILTDDDQEELTQLRDRNAWLEERVSSLESEIVSAKATIAPEDTPMVAVTEAAPEPSVADEKTRWQAAYLRTRVDALESKLIAAAAMEPAPTEVPASISEPEPESAFEAASTSDLDEELAQLRWRNRYLEGRLAYFEQAPDEETVEATPEANEAEETLETVEAEANAAPTDPEPEQADELLKTEPIVAEPEAEIHPSEAMLAELDGKQPVQVERPGDGGDDLTTITGIGPRIAEVLNGLGIWTFGQIAEWKPEHQTWIENHLSFKGRVSRENWVGQAKDLLVSA